MKSFLFFPDLLFDKYSGEFEGQGPHQPTEAQGAPQGANEKAMPRQRRNCFTAGTLAPISPLAGAAIALDS